MWQGMSAFVLYRACWLSGAIGDRRQSEFEPLCGIPPKGVSRFSQKQLRLSTNLTWVE